jgi:hypothetical protein
MIADDLRQALVLAISKTPDAETDVGRTTLLAGIPGSAYFERNRSNVKGDIMILVLALEENYSANGEWRLLQFIDNATFPVAGTDLGKSLLGIRQELLKTVRPRKVNPAETAQVHLFDLRRPVMTCVGQLPQDGGVSGFVLPCATPRLLRYFCDSLRHRGEEYQSWTRARVAATASPLVIGPLQTAVSVAADYAKKLQPLLAVKHVLWPAFLEHDTDAAALWEAAKAVFDPAPKNQMIVVFGFPENRPQPAGMISLPSPQFTSSDVEGWMMDIAKARAWQQSLVARWTAVIVMGYTSEGPLPVDIVYDRLERCHSLVNEYRDDEQGLLQELQDLEAIGG